MGNENSKASGHSDFVKNTEQPSTHLKSANKGHRTNNDMAQNVLLIWLDSNINVKSNDCQNTITQLRGAVDTVNTFTDSEQCIQFLKDMDKEKVYMIISGAFGQQIMPRVHDMSQVDSIFIFCGNRQHHEQWAKDWVKIKGVFTEIEPICEALKQAAQQCEQSATSISTMGTGDEIAKKNLDQLDPSFMYTQIMKEILLTIHFEQHHIQEFLQYCREVLAENEGQLKHVDQLERTYRKQTPIWWYTYECFLYPMLNRALRLMDVDLIIKLGFFISDLHRQIEQLHQEQFGDHSSKKLFTVYRGQGMAKGEFEKMVATKGGLLSFNCFLSTCKDQQISLAFAQHAATNPDTPMDGNGRLFRVELTLTSDKDNVLRQLGDRIREETFPDEDGWTRLGALLLKMGQLEKAQQVYEQLLNEATEESAKAFVYNQLGMIKAGLGECSGAIIYYEKSIRIEEKRIPRNDQYLAKSYNNIANVYNSMGDYSKALSFYENALAIRQQSLPPNHPTLAYSCNNIGEVYKNMGDYSKALSFYENALAVQQQSLPPNHPALASTYDNIGLAHEYVSDYSKARSFFERAVNVAQQSLPPNHPDLQKYRNHLTDIKKKL